MSDQAEEWNPQTQPSFSGRPPRPPKIAARGLADSDEPERTIQIPDPVVVSELAIALKVKSFQIVADLMALKIFKHADDLIDFETASTIANKHGYKAELSFSY